MPVVVMNRYFIKQGLEDEGLATRQRASQVRAVSGRPTGRIMLGMQPDDTTPTFIWECEYPDLAARDADAAWADESPDFSEVRSHMSRLLDNFERHVFEVD